MRSRPWVSVAMALLVAGLYVWRTSPSVPSGAPRAFLRPQDNEPGRIVLRAYPVRDLEAELTLWHDLQYLGRVREYPYSEESAARDLHAFVSSVPQSWAPAASAADRRIDYADGYLLIAQIPTNHARLEEMFEFLRSAIHSPRWKTATLPENRGTP